METKLIWLSHTLGSKTPLYGNNGKVELAKSRSISKGDSCNATSAMFPVHAGSHIDAPFHFLEDGKTIDAYEANSWLFKHINTIDITVEPGQIITPEHLPCLGSNTNTDLILLRTGFETFRDEELYWQNNPGIAPEVAQHLRQHYPNMRAIGFDFISLSSFKNREVGHAAHRAFLGDDILIFEDLNLQAIQGQLAQVVALPLRLEGADGAPCSIVAWVE